MKSPNELLYNVDAEFNWFEVRDFHRILQRAGDTEDTSPWLEEKGDPRYQVLTEEIVN